MKRTRRNAEAGLLRGPGLWEDLAGHLFGIRRRLDCVQVEVSTRCPGRCTYCPHTTMLREWRHRDMDLETFKAIWPLLRHCSRAHLQGWGEPLLNPAFFDMAALARKAGCAVSTTTSGLPMDRSLAAKLVRSGLDIVAFSLAGTDKKSNLSRQGADFEQVCEAISMLRAASRSQRDVRIEIHIAYLLLASNMPAVRGLPECMRKLGVQAAVISTLDYIPDSKRAAEGIAPHDTEKLKEAAAILKDTAAEARALGLDFHYALPGPDPIKGGCRENILRSAFVAADGSVSPCVFVNLPVPDTSDKKLVFGNVNAGNALEIWESEDYRTFRDRFAIGDVGPPCLTCVKRFETRA